MPYWGATSTPAVSVGPVSSLHDRACELYYALLGGTGAYLSVANTDSELDDLQWIMVKSILQFISMLALAGRWLRVNILNGRKAILCISWDIQ
jgi:hypothetical protein